MAVGVSHYGGVFGVITNFLLDYSALVPVAMLLVAVVCVGVGWLTLRAPRILWALVVLSVVPVVALTLVPSGSRMPEVMCAVQFSVPTLGTVELLANVALFFPPVFFATLATRRPLLMLAGGTCASAAIEAVQAVLPAIGRACDTNDWSMNTTGAAVAAALAAATLALANRTTARKPAPSPAAASPDDAPGL